MYTAYVYTYICMLICMLIWFEYNIVDRYMAEISKSCKLFFGLLSINS